MQNSDDNCASKWINVLYITKEMPIPLFVHFAQYPPPKKNPQNQTQKTKTKQKIKKRTNKKLLDSARKVSEV